MVLTNGRRRKLVGQPVGNVLEADTEVRASIDLGILTAQHIFAGLGAKMVTGTSGGGMVTATVNGRGELIGLAIEKDIVNPDEVQMLQDLIVAAVNDGARKATELGKGEMSKLTGGLNIPGMF